MKKINDWQDNGYLLSQVMFSWSNLALKILDGDTEATLQLLDLLKPLRDNILRKKRYTLLWEYNNYSKVSEADSTTQSAFISTLFLLYGQVCVSHQRRLLVGVDEDCPLWVELPAILEIRGKSSYNIFDWLYLGSLTLNFVGLFSGANPQQKYDRLLIPSPDRWPPKTLWDGAVFDNYENKIAKSLGYNSGYLDNTDLEQILAKAVLNQHYSLVPGRPVLVRFQEHEVIEQMIVMQKQDTVVAKIETKHKVDLIEFVVLNSGMWGGMTQSTKTIFLEPTNARLNYAIAGLVAHIYHDLITAQTLEGNRSIGSSAKTRSDEPTPAEAKTINWRYIPRREYIRNGGEEVVDRQRLSEQEQKRKAQLNRFQEVCGHLRELQTAHKASETKLQEAKELGIVLPEGYTWVKPHQRGLLELANEVDLSSIPHYLLRKNKN